MPKLIYKLFPEYDSYKNIRLAQKSLTYPHHGVHPSPMDYMRNIINFYDLIKLGGSDIQEPEYVSALRDTFRHSEELVPVEKRWEELYPFARSYFECSENGNWIYEDELERLSPDLYREYKKTKK
ncbi:hypothetical protein [Paenibacillus amylolyticus]|uniref:Uncharacterized protein n=1 Tax=Paenibacillus amylolyticus TaxID=1451 RepID=A0ABD8B2S2_PAEAM